MHRQPHHQSEKWCCCQLYRARSVILVCRGQKTTSWLQWVNPIQDHHHHNRRRHRLIQTIPTILPHHPPTRNLSYWSDNNNSIPKLKKSYQTTICDPPSSHLPQILQIHNHAHVVGIPATTTSPQFCSRALCWLGLNDDDDDLSSLELDKRRAILDTPLAGRAAPPSLLSQLGIRPIRGLLLYGAP